MPTLITTIGGTTSNSYVTHAEANTYFAERVPLSVPWASSGQEAALIMATRVLDTLAQPVKTLFPGPPAYYRVRQQWTGARATRGQRLAWPRIGMFDHNGNPLDTNIDSSTAPDLVTTSTEHGLLVGQEALVFGHSDTALNGPQIVGSLPTDSSFIASGESIIGGTGGRVTIIPEQLKWATSELAGLLMVEDVSLQNDVIVKGINSIRAGSVSLGFNKDIIAQVIPQSVYDMLVQSWLTDELFLSAGPRALFDVVSD